MLESSVKQRSERRSVLQRPPKTGNFPTHHCWSHADSNCFLLWGWSLWKSKTVETLPHSSKHITVSLRVKCRAAGWLSSQHPGLLWRHPIIPTSFFLQFSHSSIFFLKKNKTNKKANRNVFRKKWLTLPQNKHTKLILFVLEDWKIKSSLNIFKTILFVI